MPLVEESYDMERRAAGHEDGPIQSDAFDQQTGRLCENPQCVPTRRNSFGGDGRVDGDDNLLRPSRLLRRPSSMHTMRVSVTVSTRSSKSEKASLAERIRHKSQSMLVKKGTNVAGIRAVRRSVSPSIPGLIPSRLKPKMRLPKMVQLWSFLDRIEFITVGDVYTTVADEDSNGTVFYILNVYNYQEQQGLPTRTASSTADRRVDRSTPPARAPDYQVQHRFSDFLTLRRQIRKATKCKHKEFRLHRPSKEPCTYCRQLGSFIEKGNDSVEPLGWKTKLFSTPEMRVIQLSQFISELLDLARKDRDNCSNLALLTMLHQPASAYVDRTVPGTLRQFLTAQTGENYMRR